MTAIPQGNPTKRCRAALQGQGKPGKPRSVPDQPCVRERGHLYSDSASNPKKLHRTEAGQSFTGGIKTPSRAESPSAQPEHFTEADHQTWLNIL